MKIYIEMCYALGKWDEGAETLTGILGLGIDLSVQVYQYPIMGNFIAEVHNVNA